MLDLGTLVAKIKVDSSGAEKDISNFQSEVKNASSDVGKAFGGAVKNIGTAAAGVGGAMVALTESTREYRTEQAKLDTAFTTAGHSAQDAEETYNALYGVLGDSGQATEAANHLALLTDSQEELQKWTDICTGVYATFGDSLPIEGLTEAANETAKTGTVTGTLADALNWVGISEDEFNEKLASCSTEQERQQLIMDTLNGKYNEASDTYKNTAGSLIEANEASAELQSGMAELADAVEPVVTAFKQIISDGLQWILDNKDAVTAALLAIGTGFLVFNVASVIMTVVNAIKTLIVVTKGMTVAQAALNLVMMANPIALVAVAIATLVAAGYLLIKNWDKVKQTAQNLWTSIKSTFGNIKDWIVNKFNTIVSFLKGLPAKFKAAGRNMFLGLWNGLKSIWSSIYNWVASKVNWLIDKLAFWRKGKGEVDGKHRIGLREVPYDGYIAALHQGEMVLTAAEANQYKKGGTQSNNSTSYTINFNGTYSFRDSEDINTFMNKAQRLIDRRVVAI